GLAHVSSVRLCGFRAGRLQGSGLFAGWPYLGKQGVVLVGVAGYSFRICQGLFCGDTLVCGGPVMWDCFFVGIGEGERAGWDFFVSYTEADRAWAEWIAWVLEADGYRVLVQAWDFVPGSNWVQGMQAGV